ncbi:MAG: high frequency lysogenization protein HflD [Gammaproteobacteria bacterium]|nr:high frequency lysogenization protein HflD [Gammaproteobacteria bacterium]
MDNRTRDRVIALAAMFQAAWLTDQYAHTGQADEAALDATLGSLLEFDAATTPEIFCGVGHLKPGLEILKRVLGNRGKESDLRLTRYLVSLIGHANRLLKNGELADQLRRRLERSQQQKSHFEGWDQPVVAGLADAYVQTIGTLEPRIMVKGDPQRLQDPRVVDGVRASLLGGIRAAVLWRQLGGRRWQLLLGRRRILETADELLASD